MDVKIDNLIILDVDEFNLTFFGPIFIIGHLMPNP